MNVTAELLANATPEQKALYNNGLAELRQQFASMSDAELGCDGNCFNCSWLKICNK